MTQVYTADDIEAAAAALRAGELVAFPTETVFGLGAIANNETAVKSVYEVKGRPSDNPLIVHVAQMSDWKKWTAPLSEERARLAEQLVNQFWPGPLTLILPVKPHTFGPTVTGGLDTVGLRMPDHPLTLKLIQATGFPIVGPSANRSGKPSPTTVAHVLHDFDGKIAGVLDSAPTRIGVESTVLDLTDPSGIYILRPGYYTAKKLMAKIPELVIQTQKPMPSGEVLHPKAPGMKYRHYSPDLKVIAVSGRHFLDTFQQQDPKTTVAVATDSVLRQLSEAVTTYSLGDTMLSATQRLFAALRQYDDDPSEQTLVVELLPDEEGNQAYRNRLMKAASAVIE
ncbi:MAG: L-threonylcarbamoyladenylate synthase [Aerococcus sp.]|nr:L-threonylcarbamoyladenylate synthase [Aerococcus sp.]